MKVAKLLFCLFMCDISSIIGNVKIACADISEIIPKCLNNFLSLKCMTKHMFYIKFKSFSYENTKPT